MQQHQITSYAITAVIVVLILALRMRRAGRMRRLRLETLWIVPAIYLAFAAFLYWEYPPHGMIWGLCAAALAAGAAIGWQRGKLMRIEVDPETHQLNQRASPAAILFIFALIAVRSAARAMLTRNGGALHLNAMAVTNILIAMALGLFAATRLEMYLRAKRLLDAARAARAA